MVHTFFVPQQLFGPQSASVGRLLEGFAIARAISQLKSHLAQSFDLC